MFKSSIVAALLVLVFSSVSAQSLPAGRHAIAVFAPLYLDSAFDGTGDFAYGKSFPKFLNPGLEFYEGIQLAADSLNKTGAQIDLYVYDSRSVSGSIRSFQQKPEFSKIELIIGNVTISDVKPLAEIARSKNIPFINANLPNDGNIRNNPYYLLLNSTLKTHIEGMYKFMQKNHSLSNIIVFRKKGAQEDLLKTLFTEAESATLGVPLKLKFINLNQNFTPDQLRPYLDSNRNNLIVASSLDIAFGKDLAKQLIFMSKIYPVQLLGMPNWDGISDFQKPEYKGVEFIYSTPFYNAKSDKVSISITNYFRNNFYSRPTDMVFRGYETLMHFGQLLLEKGSNLSSSLGEKKYRVFTDFDIQPIFMNRQNPTLDYFENKKLYFVKMSDGAVRGTY
jgi:hypothetical protein